MAVLLGLSGKTYQIGSKPFSSGGEGDIYDIIGIADKVVKVYHADRVSRELEAKLQVMTKRPPSEKILSQVAWPLDVVYDANRAFCGFVMPRLDISASLSEIYVYPPKTNITYEQKLIIAQNICAVIHAVHLAGYVFGDFNPQNIGINLQTGRVAFLDTDSYHIVINEAQNKAFRCKVCMDGYVAPELLKKCEAYPKDSYASAPLPTFTKETDNFALAIHIFKLLMNGFTPFNGIKETETASTGSPGVKNQAIKRDSYCFKPGMKPQAAAVPPLDALPQEVADLFTRAFMYGRLDPKQRPNAAEWYKALSSYQSNLIQCPNNPSHQYKKGLNSCPWCEADGRYAAASAPSLGQKTFSQPVMPVAPPTPVPRPGAYGGSPNSSSSYIGGTPGGAAYGGGAYTPPLRATTPSQQPQPPAPKRNTWKIVVGVIALIVLISMVRSCGTSSRGRTGSSYQSPLATPAPTVDPARVLDVPMIDQTVYDVAANTSSATTVSPAIVERYSGAIYEKKQQDSHWFVADQTGTYFFGLEDIPEGYVYRISMYNAAGNRVDSSTYTNGRGMSQKLKAGESYNIVVEEAGYTGTYTLIIGHQTPLVDANYFTEYNDSIVFKKQVNNYSFTAPNTGDYTFSLNNVPEGFSYRIRLYNAGGYQMDSGSYQNGRGITTNMTRGQTYTISVEYIEHLGSYTLSIGKQKSTLDVTPYFLVNDSIQYRKQTNVYTLTAPYTGTYYLGFRNLSEGVGYRLRVFNEGGNQMEVSSCFNNQGRALSFKAGQTYTINVEYLEHTGTYTLVVGKPKPTLDITDFEQINDSIQYGKQVNTYTFTAQRSGTYRFVLSNMEQGKSCYLRIYNAGGTSINNGAYSNGKEFSVNLTAGESYTLAVERNDYSGGYTLTIR